MKPWAVIQYTNPREFFFVSRDGREQLGYGDRVSVNTQAPHDINNSKNHSNVYFANTRADAERLVTSLVEASPGSVWLVAETKLIYRSKMSKVSIDISKIDEQGNVLPT